MLKLTIAFGVCCLFFCVRHVWAMDQAPLHDFEGRLQKSNLVRLTEEGRLYWDQLLESGESALSPGIATPSRIWNGLKDSAGQALPHQGKGTFEFRLKGFRPLQKGYQVGLRSAGASVRLLAYPESDPSQVVTASSGKVAVDYNQAIPSQEYAVVNFYPQAIDQIWVFRFQVANFHHTRGGLWQKPMIGEGRTLEKFFVFNEQRELFTMGFLIMMVIYTFLLYLRRSEDKESLMISLTALMACLRSLSTSTFFYTYAGFNSVWLYSLQFKLEYVSFLAGPVAYMYFLHFSFPLQSRKLVVNGLSLLAGSLMLFAIASPVAYFTFILPLYHLVLIAIVLYYLWVLFAARKERADGYLYVWAGMVIVTLASLYDFLVFLDLFPQPYIVHIGIALFLVMQSQVVASRFSKAFRTAERLQKNLQLEVDKQTLEIRSIMENVPQGIFSLDEQLRIKGNYSRYLESLFGTKDLAGKAGLQLLFQNSNQSPEQQSMASSALIASLGESIDLWGFNSACLPAEIVWNLEGQTRQLALEWHPIENRQGMIQEVLVTLRNVTLLQELKAETLRHKHHLAVISEILAVGRSEMLRFFDQCQMHLDRCRGLLELKADTISEAGRKLLLHLHTIKGVARSLHLQTLTSHIHDLEEEALRAKKMAWEHWNWNHFEQSLTQLAETMNIYHSILDKELHWTEDSMSEHISQQEIARLDQSWRAAQGQRPESSDWRNFQQNLEHFILQHNYCPFRQLEDYLHKEIVALAHELGKPAPRLILNCPMRYLSRAGDRVLRSALIHLVRNALDHGLEYPEQRRLLSKPDQGTIEIDIFAQEQTCELRFRDDGCGLNLVKIQQRALDEGLIQSNALPIAQALAHLVFFTGFSTKEIANQISGRGIGMDAVRQIFHDAGGRLELALESPMDQPERQAFSLRGFLPEHYFWT